MKKSLSSIFYLLSAAYCLGQPQEAWVARYNGGFTNKNHTPLAMALDTAGSIYVAGSSQNASNDYDYVVLKYAPNGTQVWASRYASTNGGDDTLRSFALDQDGNSFLTGSGGTVKMNADGTVGWTAPYSGNGIALDTNGNTYVTGFSTVDYVTVKLDSNGSNVWLRTYDISWGTVSLTNVSQMVAVDDLGNVFVAGWEDWSMYVYPPGKTNYYSRPAVLKYDAAGNPVWTNAYFTGSGAPIETKGLIADGLGSVHVTGNILSSATGYLTARIKDSGQTIWSWQYGPPGVTGMVHTNGSVYLTGAVFDGPPRFVYGTFKLDSTNGQSLWQTNYCGLVRGYHRANGLALDSVGSVYVTGISTNTGTGNDFATIKYDNNGNQVGVKRYNGPANGDDGAMAIAVAPDGSIYVTGYSANAAGGTDITTIKYGDLQNVQKESDGSILLQFFGAPGSNYYFQATTNFQGWDELGSSIADPNGIFQFTDTNAPCFPCRFYRYYWP